MKCLLSSAPQPSKVPSQSHFQLLCPYVSFQRYSIQRQTDVCFPTFFIKMQQTRDFILYLVFICYKNVSKFVSLICLPIYLHTRPSSSFLQLLMVYYMNVPHLFNQPSLVGHFECFQSSAITNDISEPFCISKTYYQDKFLKLKSNQ